VHFFPNRGTRQLITVDDSIIKVLRYRVHLKATKFNGKLETGVYLLDLDHSGVKIETTFPLSLQSPVEISFCLTGTSQEIMVSGKVVWNRHLNDPSDKYHMGVKFYSPHWDLDMLLWNFCSKQD
jgi:hypothetical protein